MQESRTSISGGGRTESGTRQQAGRRVDPAFYSDYQALSFQIFPEAGEVEGRDAKKFGHFPASQREGQPPVWIRHEGIALSHRGKKVREPLARVLNSQTSDAKVGLPKLAAKDMAYRPAELRVGLESRDELQSRPVAQLGLTYGRGGLQRRLPKEGRLSANKRAWQPQAHYHFAAVRGHVGQLHRSLLNAVHGGNGRSLADHLGARWVGVYSGGG